MKVKELKRNLKRFWNETPARNAHLGQSGETEYLMERYASTLDGIPLAGKTVLDFGHGGGLLGKFVLEQGAERYVGYDVAERSNKVAAENLREFGDKVRLILLQDHRWDFSEHRPDVLVALAVMIHFPTKTYLDNFLATVEASGARRVILEIRDKGRGTELQPEPYSEASFALRPRTCLTCNTDKAYVAARLPSYEVYKETDPKKAPTSCQILWLKRKRAPR